MAAEKPKQNGARNGGRAYQAAASISTQSGVRATGSANRAAQVGIAANATTAEVAPILHSQTAYARFGMEALAQGAMDGSSVTDTGASGAFAGSGRLQGRSGSMVTGRGTVTVTEAMNAQDTTTAEVVRRPVHAPTLRPDWRDEQETALDLAHTARLSVSALEQALSQAKAVTTGGNQAPLRDQALGIAEQIAKVTASTLDVLIGQLPTPEPQASIVHQNGQALKFIKWACGFLAADALGWTENEALKYLSDHEPEIAQHLHTVITQIEPLAHMILSWFV